MAQLATRAPRVARLSLLLRNQKCLEMEELTARWQSEVKLIILRPEFLRLKRGQLELKAHSLNKTLLEL
jgi:hypothetical protein